MKKGNDDSKYDDRGKVEFRYYTDPAVRFQIDKILERMVKIECNNGDDNTIEENKQSYKRKQMLYYAIQQLDQLFYERIKP